MKPRIPYTKPSITDLEVRYASDAAAHGWGGNCYGYIDRFEQAFATHLNVGYALATSSCTGALQMGMAALGIGSGDEVILADTNWVATVSPVVHLGAKPVFVDIDSKTWCIDPEKAARAITSKTKAIIATHLYGNLCDMNALLALGRRFNIPVIEDAAEAIGSIYFGKKAGSLGAFGAFSFHGTKTITTGEGGMFVTDDEHLFKKVLTLSNHGREATQSKQFWPDLIGYKFKMSNIQAAIGCAQLERIDSLVSRKREIFSHYRSTFGGDHRVVMNHELDGCINGYWMPTVVFHEELGVSRELIVSKFQKANIDARVFFWPLSSTDLFKSVEQNHNAWSIPERSINLPSFHDISLGEMNRIAEVVFSLLKT